MRSLHFQGRPCSMQNMLLPVDAVLRRGRRGNARGNGPGRQGLRRGFGGRSPDSPGSGTISLPKMTLPQSWASP
ncbi:MAG: hypothetical protein MZV70_13610 [Desulfobacterales bacterium]|nr:hypothetical protein [Desulfobacterales bacterium]